MFTHTRSIDALLVVGGLAATLAFGSPALGVPIVALGVLMPLLTWWASRAGHGRNLYRWVPAEVVTAHQETLAAAALPGVVDTDEVVADADARLLEVAALLGGRVPKGATQRRFVQARVAALADAAASSRERHAAFVAAQVEVEAISTALPPVEERSTGGVLVAAFVVVLFPLFLAWDVVVGAGRACVGLVEGVALRVRTTARLLVQGVAALAGVVARAFRAWTSLRDRITDAAREAHHRVTTARLRFRLRSHRA